MTKFDKELFTYHGGYLIYHGTYEGQKTYGEYCAQYNIKCHPSRVDEPKELFIARFKYKGPVTKAKFLKQLIKNFTVEEYVSELSTGKAPLTALIDNDPEWYNSIPKKYYN